ncbi:MAG: ATP synthase subunit I [Deltaproteobacteria bacterium]|nr:ATP synthase subunit I [Deltaproteobacteria bacterium]
MDWENFSKHFKVQGWLILLIFGLLSFWLMTPAFTLGIILGGLIVIANFNLLQYTIRSAFSSEGTMFNMKKAIVVQYYFRLAILGIIIYILATNEWVDMVGLLIGLSIVVINIITMGIRFALKISSGEAV